MKREILFRGKIVDNGDWVEGYYSYEFERGYKSQNYDDVPPRCHYINGVEVIGSTFGQFTGLTDKKGKNIFEGDILSVNGIAEDVTVFFDKQMSSMRMKSIFKNDRKPLTYGFDETEYCEIEVIGNIHDVK